MHTLVCGKDQADAGYQSGLVNLMLSSHNEAIKTLFHQSTSDLSNPHVLTTHFQSLFVYFCYAFILGLLTYGIAVPSGLFVPAIMSGASLGRLVGEFGQALLPESSFALSPGSWALVGAAAMLGGISRMTISITVIVVESSQNLSYLLPIATTILVAKLVGDLFSDGIYDVHVKLKQFPAIPDQPGRERERLRAKEIMAAPVRSICELEQVGTLVKLLRHTKHNGFPVVAKGGGATGGGQPRVLGVILREQLLTILAKRQFIERRPSSAHLGLRPRAASPRTTSPPLCADDFLRPWFADTERPDALGLSDGDLDLFINLRPYVNEAALVTLQNTSLRRVSRLFRTMGLRHLLVVESCPKVVGIITRKDVLYGGGAPGGVPRDASDLRMTYNTDPRGTATQDGDDDDDGDGAPNGGGSDGGWQPLGWVGSRLSELRGRLSSGRSRTTGRSTLSATGAGGGGSGRTTTADGEIAAATDAGAPAAAYVYHADGADGGGAAAAAEGPAEPLLAGGADADGWQPPPPMLSASPPRGSTPEPLALYPTVQGLQPLQAARAAIGGGEIVAPAPAAPPLVRERSAPRTPSGRRSFSASDRDALLDESALLDPSAENRAAPIGSDRSGPCEPGEAAVPRL